MRRKPHGAAALWAALLLLMLFANIFAGFSVGYTCANDSGDLPAPDSPQGHVCAWQEPHDQVITMTPAAVALIPFWLLLVGGALALFTRNRRVIAVALAGPYALLVAGWVTFHALPSN